jgi:hypothetical protein
MNFTGVTIGVGEPYETCARSGCREVENILKLETRLITKEHIDLSIGATQLEQAWSLKFRIFDIYPDLENVMFFDCDWRPLKYFNVEEYCPNRKKAYFVPDRSDYWFIQDLERQYGFLPGTYVNSGWFVVNKTNHCHLFTKCREEYYNYPKSFYGEQDMFNHIFRNELVLADRCLNVQDLHRMPFEQIIGLHNRAENHKFYGINE